jgi:hypothetical protein
MFRRLGLLLVVVFGLCAIASPALADQLAWSSKMHQPTGAR